jgi:predicted transcriptional regulator
LTPNARAYRTRLEVLRDILGVPGEEANKSRIIRLANLNPTAFDRYVSFCLDSGLLELADNRYRKTGVCVPAIQAINHVLAKAEELGSAIRELGTTIGLESLDPEAPVLRFASSAAWGDLTRSGARGSGYALYPVAPKWVSTAAPPALTAGSGAGTRSKELLARPRLRARVHPGRRRARRSPPMRGK